MKVHHVAICVTNLKNSIAFYKKYFNFRIKKKFRKEEFNADFCIIEKDGFEIELFAFDKENKHNNNPEDLFRKGIRHLAFEVENIREEVRILQEKGLTFTEIKKGKSGSYYTFCNDPDGVQLELLEVIK